MHENKNDLGCCFSNLAEMLQSRACQFPELTAFVFEDDEGNQQSWTFAQLELRSRSLGRWLARRTSVGDRVLLVYPPGLEFIAAFMGCVYAGALPVPATYPKPRRPSPRLDSIVEDCRPSLVLTHSSSLAGLCLDQQSPAISELSWEPTDLVSDDQTNSFEPISRSAENLAFLQYTSGSTSEPRGVMVSHGNILHNLEAIRTGFSIDGSVHQKGVFWLPAYHDMGLIGSILTPIYVGGTSTLIAPTTFLRRPQRWLELMSETQATISGSPDFGYKLAVTKMSEAERDLLDLSHWRLAFCGAEPINPATLDEFATAFESAGFRRSAFYPCYGLAESTVIVTGGQHPSGPRVLHVDRAAKRNHRVVPVAESNGSSQALVGCGQACKGITFRIVDPVTLEAREEDQIGEIWVQGDSVAPGYWNQEATNNETFRAKLVNHGDGEFLRTGDLGFSHEGELYVTGRLKDVIIVRGRNHYPQDLERTAQAAHEAVDLGAAFPVEVEGHEQLVLVFQWRREFRGADHEAIMHAIRTAIVEEHEIDPHAIVLIRPASLPITSSGKVQRKKCREQFLKDELAVTAQWTNHLCSGDELPAESTMELSTQPDFLAHATELSTKDLQENVQEWLVVWLSKRTNIQTGLMHPDTPFAELGIDSLTAVEVSQEIDQLLGLQSPPMVIWSCPTPKELAQYLAGELQAPKVR
ncbi:Long-chain-fatty-acid--AMP ligase FadD29 [Bythopirellula goksoeyrii]|uniref:Long-chain-fatty-acid--AMP ligase FadD29 n=2 Tax=Bythopirellula goksoeyrii TaxID=1400387 RepID=A0A5B9QRP9_9BACT|nr:Long-chain-fatty-acid--AMP ligase FadD29 [Bythopirellula goksoeyrii]